MAYTYKHLTAEQREQIIDQRIAQFEAEHFSHSLNKNALSELPNSAEKTKALAESDAAQAGLEAAITAAGKGRAPAAPPGQGGGKP